MKYLEDMSDEELLMIAKRERILLNLKFLRGEIINNLEGVHRGPYGGAVGYFDFCGNMDMCITIRTITIDEDVAIVQTGAGIVADSVPENEYNEVLQKAKVMFQVIKEVEADDFTN